MGSKLFLGALAVFLATAGVAEAKGRVSVRGYTKSNGTYVAPAVRTAPDRTRLNNYSTKGNVNPYTGTAGKKPVIAPAKP